MSERQMTSIADQIRSAVNQRDALIIIGEALDRIEEKQAHPLIQVPAVDSWTVDWPADGMGGRPASYEAAVAAQPDPADAKKAAHDALVEKVKAERAAAWDGDEIRALDAKLRLLQDEGRALAPIVPEGKRSIISSDGSTGVVEFPPPSPERRAARLKWASDVALHESLPLLNEEQTLDAFTKGGGMWLYMSAFQEVLGMPVDWKRWLIQDIAVDSEAEAQEVGRAIIKLETDHVQAINRG